jgi:cellulose synthase/poly-beta-1,6-N-acetylglucosamine synthase-like glycosyltransferase
MNLVSALLYGLFFFVQVLVAIYILVPTFSLLSYLLLNWLKIKTPYQKKPFLTDRNFEFGFIVTAHQEAQFILPIVDSILKQSYPNFYVYVVADDCDLSGIHFADPRVVVLKPEPPLHAKIKSIRYAIAEFKKKHDAIIILDSDNLIHPQFLQVMNNHFRKGYRVVQADFKPKNTDTVYARMDAIGDLYNFFLDREARMRLGISSSIWGSGVAIDYDLYNEVEYTSFLGGFDKKMQAHLVQRVPRMMFAPEAILYDEKVASGKSLETQRTRWIFAYFKYFKDSWAIFRNGIKRGNFNLIYFGFITLRPPLFIVLGAALLITVINYFVSTTLFVTWLLLLLSFVLSFVGIVLLKGKNAKYLYALLLIPVFVLRQVAALLKIKRANKAFLKTQHTKLVFIDDLLKRNVS